MPESVPSEDEIGSTLRNLIADLAESEPGEVGDDDDFFEDLGLDSMSIIELAVELEKQLGIAVNTDELTEVRTLARARAFVVARLSEHSA